MRTTLKEHPLEYIYDKKTGKCEEFKKLHGKGTFEEFLALGYIKFGQYDTNSWETTRYGFACGFIKNPKRFRRPGPIEKIQNFINGFLVSKDLGKHSECEKNQGQR